MVNRLSQPIPVGDLPRSVDEAVDRLISELPLGNWEGGHLGECDTEKAGRARNTIDKYATE